MEKEWCKIVFKCSETPDGTGIECEIVIKGSDCDKVLPLIED